jgi:hypothetical protein
MHKSRTLGWAALIAVGFLTPAAADELRARAAAKAALAKYKDAVVTVRLALKRRWVFQGKEGGSMDASMEIAGTVLTPAGLTVVSDFDSNPMPPMQNEGAEGPKMETETTDVKILTRDGRELPARFVLRDRDLDLAFLLPEEKGLTLPHVPLEKGAVPETLDDIIFMQPLGPSLGREVAVMRGQVRAVVRKPRTFVVSDPIVGLQALGCPAFDDAGRAVGVVVLRRTPNPPQNQGGGLRDFLDYFQPVILTAADVQEVAAQAGKAEAKPEAKP